MKFSSKRFLFGIPLVAAVLVGLLGWWTDRAVRDTIESTVHAALKAGLEANVTALDIWINTQTRLAAVVTDDPDFQSSVADLLERPAEPTREWRRAEPSAAAQTVQRQLDQRIRSSGFAAAVVIGTAITNLHLMMFALCVLPPLLASWHAATPGSPRSDVLHLLHGNPCV